MANRTTIEIYTRQKTFLHPLFGAGPAFCPQCQAEVMMVTPESAAAVLQIAWHAIPDLIESGQLHKIETQANSLLICSNSLFIAAADNELDLYWKRP